MTESDNEENNKTQEELSSFNSATDHYRNIMGAPTQKLIWKKCRASFAILGILLSLSLQ
ncbi:hypothetical protein [Paenibacillus sp. GM2]|uniref:hypothetical protein n=1 Tax=Paenibacillus sp. GM2 TaxID=1622070 RepID=UPI000AC82819|nr:hypothetical protein [Paenibacillus sp. GM2]